jgi:hypothetical protein
MQFALKQALHLFDDNQIIELLDCDMFHLKPMPDFEIKHDEFMVCDFYEDWHLRSLSQYKKFVYPFLKTDNPYNGGFVPIVGHVKTFKKILDDWITAHLAIYPIMAQDDHRWWSGMYSFQVACSNNNIKMRAVDTCYIPVQNEFSENHYVGHYSCDPNLDKNSVMADISKFDSSRFLDNKYYQIIQNWHKSVVLGESCNSDSTAV